MYPARGAFNNSFQGQPPGLGGPARFQSPPQPQQYPNQRFQGPNSGYEGYTYDGYGGNQMPPNNMNAPTQPQFTPNMNFQQNQQPPYQQPFQPPQQQYQQQQQAQQQYQPSQQFQQGNYQQHQQQPPAQTGNHFSQPSAGFKQNTPYVSYPPQSAYKQNYSQQPNNRGDGYTQQAANQHDVVTYPVPGAYKPNVLRPQVPPQKRQQNQNVSFSPAFNQEENYHQPMNKFNAPQRPAPEKGLLPTPDDFQSFPDQPEPRHNRHIPPTMPRVKPGRMFPQHPPHGPERLLPLMEERFPPDRSPRRKRVFPEDAWHEVDFSHRGPPRFDPGYEDDYYDDYYDDIPPRDRGYYDEYDDPPFPGRRPRRESPEPPRKKKKKNKPTLDEAEAFSLHRARKEAKAPPPMTKGTAWTQATIKNSYLVPVSAGTEKITMDIWKYFLSARMEEADLRKKLILRKSLLSILNGAFPNCCLFIVGSSMTGFATKTSDVDMCLMITEEEIDQKRDAALILNAISKAIKQLASVQYNQVIKAKVPILKFYDKLAGVECDLNINNLIGIRNTHLVRYYAYLDWRVRPLMLYIKKWARFHDINDASKQTVSSYSLTLMLIHYLQVGVDPPVLPCLQKLKPALFDTRVDVRLLNLKFDQEINFTSKNRATLGELFLGFLNYYANTFEYSSKIISVRLGRLMTFDEVAVVGNTMQWKHLNIEEPFEKTNTARSVYDKFVFTRVQRVFKTTYETLEKWKDVEEIFKRPF